MKNVQWSHVLALLALITVIHFSAVTIGLYDQQPVWIDIPLHFLGGAWFSMLFLWIAGDTLLMQSARERFVVSVAIVGAALIGSVLWELFEFVLVTFVPSVAFGAKWYSLRVSDLLSDVVMGMLGGVVAAIVMLVRER